jgi:hypothetical protein
VVAERLGHAAVGIALDQCSHVMLSDAWGAAVVASRICEPAGRLARVMALIAEQGTLQ